MHAVISMSPELQLPFIKGKGTLILKEPLLFLDPPFFIVVGSKNYPGFLRLNFPLFFSV